MYPSIHMSTWRKGGTYHKCVEASMLLIPVAFPVVETQLREGRERRKAMQDKLRDDNEGD
jgi:hypothetical protein